MPGLLIGESMKSLVLTCSELDGGRRRSGFRQDRFPDVEFVQGMSQHSVNDVFSIAKNGLDYGFGEASWDAGALAVAYGHFRIWNRVVELDQTCLVLEDDAKPVPRWELDYFRIEEKLDLSRLPGKWFLTLWRKGINECKAYNDTFLKVVPSYSNSGLVGYVLTPETARILVDGFPAIRCPVDHFALGIGFGEPAPYTVFSTTVNLIEHDMKFSLRATSRYPLFDQLRESRRVFLNRCLQLPVIRTLHAKYLKRAKITA